MTAASEVLSALPNIVEKQLGRDDIDTIMAMPHVGFVNQISHPLAAGLAVFVSGPTIRCLEIWTTLSRHCAKAAFLKATRARLAWAAGDSGHSDALENFCASYPAAGGGLDLVEGQRTAIDAS
jgi:hypothetical protein